MTKELDELVKGVFGDKTLKDLSVHTLENLCEKQPYCSVAHFLLTAKHKQDKSPLWTDALAKLSVRTNHLNWLMHLMMEDGPADVQQEDLSIPIEPYHTIDYFASQGIKLGLKDQNDLLARRVKSFTSWLKTMKKIPPASSTGHEESMTDPDNTGPTSSEIAVTEAMADVYLKQGLRDKAIAVLGKLSLQNPDNSHIFARRIADIKENRI